MSSDTSLGNHTKNSCIKDTRRENQPLTTRAIRIKKNMVDGNGHSLSWKESLHRLKWTLEKSGVSNVFESPDGEEISVEPEPRQFTPRWVDKYHSRTLDGFRQIQKEFNDLHTVHIVLTGSAYKSGQPMCFIDFYRDLCESYNSPTKSYNPIYNSLYNKLKGTRWAYVMVDAPHPHPGSDNKWYPHRHIGIGVEGSVKESDFHNIIDLHIKHSPVAQKDAHDYQKAVNVERIADMDIDPCGPMDRMRGTPTPLAREITKHLPKVSVSGDTLKGSTSDKYFAAAMNAVNNQVLKTSNTFNEYADKRYYLRTGKDPDYSSDEDFEHIGYEVDGEVYASSSDDDKSHDNMTVTKPISNYY